MKDSNNIVAYGITPEIAVSQSTSPISKEHEALVRQAIQDAKKVRQTALDNAKEAFEEAFSEAPDVADRKIKKDSYGNAPLQATVKIESVSNNKGFEETKKILETFRTRMERYAKYISKEGSAILCIKIANSKEPQTLVFLNELPFEDRVVIEEMVKECKCTIQGSIYVEMDDYRDFVFRVGSSSAETPYHLFNTTLHPKPSNVVSDVPVKNDGETISIGGKINLNKRDVQKMIGVEEKFVGEDDAYPTKKTPSMGRNAYDIRTDILDMSLGFHSKNVSSTEDDIIKTAQKFYSFVEQKRIR